MSNQASEDGLRELAERYAKDFGIRYDKIRINQKGSITYRQSGDNSGGWQESGDSLNLPTWVITRHYSQVKKHELQARIDEMKLHRHEWALFGDRPPYRGESVSLPILLAYHDDRIDELKAQQEAEL